MADDARAVANFFLDLAWARGRKISHLSLQKVLFFAHAWHLAKYDRPLIGQSFEAWKYGPVVRVVYDQLKRFGASQITERLTKLDLTSGDLVAADYGFEIEREAFLSDLFRYYSQFHAAKLVDLTHVADGPWENVWNKAVDKAVPGMLIPNEEIKLWILREGGRERSWSN